MNKRLFKEVNYTFGVLLSQIKLGVIGLPDIQRPFVWLNAKVRDLLDSMYKTYPVGFFLFWQTGEDEVSTKGIGQVEKQKAASLLIVDGQQRLTSLYAVVMREPVLRDNFEHDYIRIAFNPSKGEFAVPDATTEKQPEFIHDVSSVFQHEYLLRLLWAARYLTLLGFVTENLLAGIARHVDAPGAAELFAPWPTFPYGQSSFQSWCQQRYPFWYRYHQGRLAAGEGCPAAN